MCINLNNINDFHTYEVGNITIFRDEENKLGEVNDVVQSHTASKLCFPGFKIQ